MEAILTSSSHSAILHKFLLRDSFAFTSIRVFIADSFCGKDYVSNWLPSTFVGRSSDAI
jgi:hypothetical protein